MSVLNQNTTFIRYYNTFRENPSSIVFVPLAEILIKQGLLDEADTVITEGLKYNPGLIMGRLALAKLYLARSELNKALSEVEAVLKDAPGNEEALALAQRTRQAPSGDVMTQSPKGGGIFSTLTMARIYASQGLIDEARAVYEEILAREPENMTAREDMDRLNDQ